MSNDLFLFQTHSLCSSRIHEFTGPARMAAVIAILAQSQRRSLWICGRPGGLEQINLEGLLDLGMIPPDVFAQARTPVDALWASEQALRSGCGLVVVADLPTPLDLTTSRRLQLAAEAGQTLGLCLVPNTPQTTASETRWHCSSTCASSPSSLASVTESHCRTTEDISTVWRWTLIKNKKGTIGTWTIHPHVTATASPHHLTLAASPADRSLDQAEPPSPVFNPDLWVGE